MKIGYIRVSTEEQNTARQEALLRELDVDEVFIDKASGKNTDRPELTRMMEYVRHGDTVIVESISRFARNTNDCLKNIRELKSLGITIMFEKENIDTANITDELMLTIMGGLAQEESTSISQNLKWSIRRKMKSGAYSPVNAPLGYQCQQLKRYWHLPRIKKVKQEFKENDVQK